MSNDIVQGKLEWHRGKYLLIAEKGNNVDYCEGLRLGLKFHLLALDLNHTDIISIGQGLQERDLAKRKLLKD